MKNNETSLWLAPSTYEQKRVKSQKYLFQNVIKLSDGADNAVISNKNEYGEHTAKRVLTVKTISLYMTGRRAANSRFKGRDYFVNDLWSSNAPHIAKRIWAV